MKALLSCSWMIAAVSLVVILAKTATAFQQVPLLSQQLQQRQSSSSLMAGVTERFTTNQRIDEDSKLLNRKTVEEKDNEPRRRRRCSPCENNQDDDDFELDRREAAFSMLGTLWAVTTGVATSNRLFPTQVAQAAYGDEAKIQLPNPLENIILRSNQGCLVESLGNRECLVYGSSDDKIYQGANGQVLAQRLQQSVVALATIPDLALAKKWSAIQGVLRGPMGELIATMNQLLQLKRDNNGAAAAIKAAEQLAVKVKQDIFAISAAAERKQGEQAVQSQQQATADLVAFLKALE